MSYSTFRLMDNATSVERTLQMIINDLVLLTFLLMIQTQLAVSSWQDQAQSSLLFQINQLIIGVS